MCEMIEKFNEDTVTIFEGFKKEDYSVIYKLWDSEESEKAGSKFKVGDKVFFPDMMDVFEIKGINYMGDDEIVLENGDLQKVKIFEYALSGYKFLVYEDELEIPVSGSN